MADLTEQWVNIYKSKKHGSYWTGAFCYKTKEEAVKDLADREHYLTTVNIEDMLQKSENVAKNVANEKLQLLEQVSAFELRDQLQIKDMRISKLKEKNVELKELLQECRETLLTAHSLFLDTISGCTIETILNKFDEIDNVIYEQLTKTDEVLK